MLAAVPGHIIVSEAEPFDALLAMVLAGQADAWHLRAMAAALLRDRDGTGGHRVLKLDAWHMLAWRLLRTIFPVVPMAFLYRELAVILVSHARMSGRHVVPGQVPLDLFELDAAPTLPPSVYAAQVLGAIAGAAADAAEEGAVVALINHRDMPDAVEHRLVPLYGMALTDEGRERLRAAGQRDAKQPAQAFAGDTAAKRQAADADIIAAADRHMRAPYARLERLARR